MTSVPSGMTLSFAVPLAGLVVLLGTCRSPAPATGPELLSAAHRTMGATDSVGTIASGASVASPSGGFEVRIASARAGDVRLAMGRSFLAGVHDSQGWSCDSAGSVTALDSLTRSVVRGHDLHMLVVAPTWLAAPVRGPDQHWGQDSVMTLRFQDELGAPLLMHLRRSDTLPLGLDLINHSGSGPREVRVTFADWQHTQGVRLFHRATFEHGGNRFIYTYHHLALNTLEPAAFVPSCGAVAD